MPVILAITLALAAGLAAAQETLRTTVRVVIAPTTVTDRREAFVDGLTKADFAAFEDGQPQPFDLDFTYFPISLVLAVQTGAGANQGDTLAKVRRVGSLIEPLVIGERGEAAVVTYGDEVAIAQDFTSDADRVRNALRRLQDGGEGSCMTDAVIQSVQMLAARPLQRRRVLLLLGEARDHSSQAKLEEAVTLAQKENVVVYCLTYSTFMMALTKKKDTPVYGPTWNLAAVITAIRQAAKKNAAQALADYTGGAQLSFLRQRALEAAVSRIGEELHAQYLVSFRAHGAPGEFHTIEVKVPGRPELKVRTRPGYWVTE